MLRPSGVSSASDASRAASASTAGDTPGAGTKAAAWRLPNVIVPVLSSSRTLTSPAASIARPEVAMTLARIMRLMPATPMADSRPPMVVGIRQTSRATSTVIDTACPAPEADTAYIENGSRLATTSRNTSVRPTSRMVSASSLGVFWRRALSTMAIMRSRKLSPGSAAMRTKIQSDRTRVPPVTEQKSLPAARITGADSPVMALLSTEAMPAITCPSPGTVSPASIRTTSSLRSAPEGREVARERQYGGSAAAASLSRKPVSTRASMVVRKPRRAAACCLPRPSANASAKLANSTVNQRPAATARMKPAGASARPARASSHNRVVRMLPA
ncbi:Uncharacterised protein [Bordetella pertussis]|nr:Uncharacterised protein [Bordetella pertussis]CFM37225.1 Uncharacterised protein [Bordetella pertussis]CFO39640.1 Uncharacterised protein [Bordetella pertussis]CFO56351.1 Uncharacterised protein [Bordetella pertussis]CFP25689.1 Uncharacterised protein [Bordetella pertussis]